VGDVYRSASPSVVEVTVTGGGSGFGQEQSQGQGSGFVYDTEGHVVTNQHVVDGADSVNVRFSNGAGYEATVVGTDSSTDVAVLKVEAPAELLAPLALADSSTVALADSSTVEVGDAVVALGSPFGLEGTLTSGIVSALHREITSPNNFSISDVIQTDAAINHGNSGGPLLDLEGRVIGVNSQIESESGGNDGIGFAVPSNTVRSIADQLIADGSVEHAYLGVGVQSIPATVADELGSVEGVALATVREGTPAAEAGLRGATGTQTVSGQEYPTGGDVITAIDGEAITSDVELRSLIDSKQPGDEVRLTYHRDGESSTVTVTLAERPA
jgi:S1-C subfamily serine protease